MQKLKRFRDELKASTMKDTEGHGGKPKSFNHRGQRGTRMKTAEPAIIEDTEEPSGMKSSDNPEH